MGILSKVKNLVGGNRQERDAARRRATLDQHAEVVIERFPELIAFKEKKATYLAQLKNDHDYYIQNVSSEEMALSINCAILLGHLVSEVSPRRVLDLGSGFSSYILRLFSARHGGVVYSVDDNKDWLGKTQEYLQTKNVSTDNLMTWADFQEQFKMPTADSKFDLIFHDLGNMETRKEALDQVFRLANTEALILLDDMHKPHYFDFVEKFLQGSDVEFSHLEKALLDNHGRWSTIVRKK